MLFFLCVFVLGLLLGFFCFFLGGGCLVFGVCVCVGGGLFCLFVVVQYLHTILFV